MSNDTTRYFRNGHYVDPVNVDALDEAEHATERRASDQLATAQRAVSALRMSAHRFPELAAHADELDKLADRAEGYELARDKARAAVRTAEAERNAAGRVAIHTGKDPMAAEKATEKALKAAQENAERAERHWFTAASLASGEANKANALIQRLNKENAGPILRDALIALDEARTAAIDAAEDARRKLGAMHAYVLHVRGAANLDPDSELAKLAHSDFHPDNARRGSNRLTYNAVLQELDGMPARLAYSGDDPLSSDAHKLGISMGKAVAIARERKGDTRD